MAGHHLIDGYLATLDRYLPAEAVEELAGGLADTYGHHREAGLDADAAARAAIAEFGTAPAVVAAFADQSPRRRLARVLIATGPAVGLCWGAALVSRHAWAWPVPVPVRAAFGAVLVTAIACLVVTGTTRIALRRGWTIAVGGLGLVGLDAAMITALVLVAPAPAWPFVLAGTLSAARASLTARALLRLRRH